MAAILAESAGERSQALLATADLSRQRFHEQEDRGRVALQPSQELRVLMDDRRHMCVATLGPAGDVFVDRGPRDVLYRSMLEFRCIPQRLGLLDGQTKGHWYGSMIPVGITLSPPDHDTMRFMDFRFPIQGGRELAH